MKKTILVGATLLITSLSLWSFDLPKEWVAAGDKPGSYEMGVDKGAGQNGQNAATIQSKEIKIKGFGTLMQKSSPEKYRGKRVRMTGYIKSENVKEWAGLWFRVDGDGDVLAFDNMQKRAVKGTSEWKKYEIVLDVSDKATQIAYGALLAGTGKIWFDNVNFEIVTPNTPSTDLNK